MSSTTHSPTRARAPILALEGPPAVGKTTLSRALAEQFGAMVIPELDASGAPSPRDAEPWFTDRHAAAWQQAERDAAQAPLVVMDGDPWKGLWYNWLHADEGWPGIDVVAPLCAAAIDHGRLALPDLWIILDADVDTLRARRAGDPTRRRRNHDRHLTRLPMFSRYMHALAAIAPSRVVHLSTHNRAMLPSQVMEQVAMLPPAPPTMRESHDVLTAIADWLRAQPQ
jgi:thymidylate kinase